MFSDRERDREKGIEREGEKERLGRERERNGNSCHFSMQDKVKEQELFKHIVSHANIMFIVSSKKEYDLDRKFIHPFSFVLTMKNAFIPIPSIWLLKQKVKD